MAAASQPTRLDAEINIISAKHLKNVNWRFGELKPYAVVHLDADHYYVTTKTDDSGSTSPVWNERFTLPLPGTIQESFLTVEIFHYKPSDTPKPLVGTAWTDLTSLIDPTSPIGGPAVFETLDLFRPSGRLHGKVRIMISLRERPSRPPANCHIPPTPSGRYPLTVSFSVRRPPSPVVYGWYSASSPPPPSLNQPPPPPLWPTYYENYSDLYSQYYSSSRGSFSVPPPPVDPVTN